MMPHRITHRFTARAFACLTVGIVFAFASPALAADTATTASGDNSPRYIPPACDTVPVFAATCGDREHQILREKTPDALTREELNRYVWVERRCESDRAYALSQAQSCRERHAQAQAKFAAEEKARLALTPEVKRQWRERYQGALFLSASMALVSTMMYSIEASKPETIAGSSCVESDPSMQAAAPCAETTRKDGSSENRYGILTGVSLLATAISGYLAHSMR